MLKLGPLLMLPMNLTSMEEPSGLNSQDRLLVPVVLLEATMVKLTLSLLEIFLSEPRTGPLKSTSKTVVPFKESELPKTKLVEREGSHMLNSTAMLLPLRP